MARVNDDELGDDRVLWRRIIPSWIYENDGKYYVQSLAFVDRLSGELSVFVADLTDEDTVMAGRPDDSLIAFRAGIPRSEGCIVAKTPEDPNPAHRVICHETNSGMKRAAKQISKNIEWVRLRPPPDERPGGTA